MEWSVTDRWYGSCTSGENIHAIRLDEPGRLRSCSCQVRAGARRSIARDPPATMPDHAQG